MFENNKFLRFLFKFLVILVIIKLIFIFVNLNIGINMSCEDFFLGKNNKIVDVDIKNYKYKNIDFDEISNIKIIDSANIVLKENDNSNEISIKYYDSDDLKYDIDVKNNTLILKNSRLNHKYKNLELNILLPKKILKNIDINNKNGDIDIDLNECEKLIIKNINGNIDVKIKNTNGNINFSGNSNKIKIGNTNGNVYFNGASNDIEINNMNGKINCDIKGNKNDYNMNLKSVNVFPSINDIKIDENNKDLNINKNKYTNKNLNLKTFNGTISIMFL